MSGIRQNCRFPALPDYTRCMIRRSTNMLLNGRRPIVIVLMLVASLVLIGMLGWQSWRLQQSNDAAALSVQRDYGNLAADEYGRRITAALGYRGYFQIISRIDEPASAEDMRATIEQDASIAGAARLIEGLFVADSSGVLGDGLELSPALQQKLSELVAEGGELGGPYKSISVAPNGPRLVYTRRTDENGASRVFGFTVAVAGIVEYLQEALDGAPLLPESLGSGKVGNDKLFVEVLDANGEILLVANSLFDYSLIVAKTMGDDYQGVVEGYTIRVSVDPRSAGALVIGGLPANQLPLLLVIMAMVVTLLLTAIWLFRREQAVMNMRADFVSQVSHELRTPLTQIRMFAETLLLKRTRSEDEQQRSLEIIDRESRRLSHLVENILLFSRVSDLPKVDPQLQLVAPLVREVCETVRVTSQGAIINLTADDSITADVDDDALRQVLLNLLDNAIKYGPVEQQIIVAVSRAEEFVRIEISDEGPGIPAAERERVWGAFYRLGREQQTAISGTGIGLAVVRELIEAMHGRCWIAETATGTCVVVELPGPPDND